MAATAMERMTEPSARSVAMAPRRWTLNGDFLGLKATGVRRYAVGVVTALDALCGERHPLTDGLQLELVGPQAPEFPLQHIGVRVLPEFRSPRLPLVWTQLQLPTAVRGGLISFANLGPIAVGQQIACIHDLHTFIHPESFSLAFRTAHRIILPLLGRRARRVTTVSALARDQLVAYGVAAADKIVVTYNGADHAADWRSEAASLALGNRPYVLCLGRDHPYKNMALVWRIAPQLDRLGLDVVVVGSMSEVALQQLAPQPPANLRLVGRVSDDEFAAAIDGARCFLMPSRIEGFGIPRSRR